MRTFKRGKSVYVQWAGGKVNGKYTYPVKGGFRTIKEAEQWYFEHVATKPQVPRNRLTVQEYTDLWLEEYARRLEERSYESYEGQARRYLGIIADVKLRDLSPAHIRSVYSAMRAKKLAEATILKVHRQLKLMCRCAIEWQLLATNPVDMVQAPKPLREQAPNYDPDETACVLTAARDTIIYPLLLLIACTGLARSEARGLQWQDFSGNILQVRRSRQWRGKREIVKATKRERRSRRLWVADDVLEALGPRGIGSAWVFPYTDHVLTYWLRKVRTIAGLDGAKLHILRHGYASIAIHAGVSVTDVSATLGHSLTSTTLDIYSHEFVGHEEATGRKVAEVVRTLFAPKEATPA